MTSVEFGAMYSEMVPSGRTIPGRTLAEIVDAVVDAVVASIPDATLLPASQMREIARHGAEVSAALPPSRRQLGIAAAARWELQRELLHLNGVVLPPAM
jgi:hypothetical protein